jgi:putative ABC transport system permease protein
MSWRRHLARLRTLFSRRDPTAELDQEIRTHLEFEEEENVASGMPRDEARYAALRHFGNITVARESSYDMWFYRFLEDWMRDVRFGLRVLSKNPGFVAAAAITLALGIGANTAIFSFADLIIRRPVALAHLDRLVAVSESIPWSDRKGISPANYRDLLNSVHSLENLAAYQFHTSVLAAHGNPETVTGVRVTPNFFSTLGLKPALGRTFLPTEIQLGTENLLVISYSFWQGRFGGVDVVGKTILLNQRPFTVIGVMSPKSSFPLGAPQFWMPLVFTTQEKSERLDLTLRTVGRLAPGASLEQARAEVEALWLGLKRDYPAANQGRDVRVVHLLDEIVLDYNRQFMLMMLGVVGFVLLIACANVANLQLARAAGRRREIAVRASLGADRARILAQLLTESVLLASAGGLIGLLLAWLGVHVLRATLPPDVQEFCDLNDLRLDGRAMVFTLLLTLIVGLIAGFVPAWRQTVGNLLDGLKEGGGRVAGGQGFRLQRILVMGELALALVLLIGAGLMVKGFAALLNANPSLGPDSLATIHLDLTQERYRQAHQARAFSEQLLAGFESMPGIEEAAVVSGLPYSFYDESVAIHVTGQPQSKGRPLPTVMPEAVSPAYFRTLRIPLREGREFDSRDGAGAAPVAIVSESMARRLWPGESAIGKKLSLEDSSAGEPTTIVGVVGDILHEVYDHSFRSILYLPYEQAPPRSMDFVMRTGGDATQVLAAARLHVQEIDSAIPIENLETMTEKIRKQTSGLRYVAQLMGVFGALALILSAVGVYGVMAYAVNERRREIGIRLALGAQRRDVLALLMRSGISLTSFGLAVGIVLALALTHAVASLIYGVSSWDAVAFADVLALLAVIALFANYVPARRATRLDPMTALRYE